jgi:hypothetical protein
MKKDDSMKNQQMKQNYSSEMQAPGCARAFFAF